MLNSFNFTLKNSYFELKKKSILCQTHLISHKKTLLFLFVEFV